MLCESCNEHEATIHLTQVVDGAVKKLHLCEECAAKSGFDVQSPMSITDILLGMGGQLQAAPEETDRSCPRCHMRRIDFKKTGRLGCPECYETFASDLGSLLKAMHRSEHHVGKVPSREGDGLRLAHELETLQKELDRAVAQEHYEDAARLRDDIAACRRKLEVAGRREKSHDG